MAKQLIILEGISQAGKTSLYQRNKEFFGQHTYTHPHMSEVGQILKAMWVDGHNREELAAYYIGLNLGTLTTIETMLSRFNTVVLDRTYMSTQVINVPSLIAAQAEYMEPAGNEHPWDEIFDYYFTRIDRLQKVFNEQIVINFVFMNATVFDARYEIMHRLNDRYVALVKKLRRYANINVLDIDASLPMDQIDSKLQASLF